MDEPAPALGPIAWDILQRIVRDRIARKPGGHLLEGKLDRTVVRVPLALGGEEATAEAFSDGLVRAIDRAIEDAILHVAAFRPGHAFCHRCGESSCEHSEPPTARHVFVEYAPTGAPRWEDFAQVCLDRRHPDVDRLFDDTPAFVTLAAGGPELNRALVGRFPGLGAFELAGQVVAGFWPVRMREGEGRGVVALTFQVGVSRPAHGEPRFGLNVLGRTPFGEPLELLWERQDDLPWRQAVRWAQAALGTVTRGRRVPAVVLEERVEAILRGLARRLERDRRARTRRTHHAEVRHRAGDRPTRQAIEDARHAKADAILYDERHATFVIPGARGRTHFFSADGRLVSSVRYGRDALERKRKLGLWRGATPEQVEALLQALAGACL